IGRRPQTLRRRTHEGLRIHQKIQRPRQGPQICRASPRRFQRRNDRLRRRRPARAYQQKRDTASAPPPLTKEDARSAETRTAQITFLKTRGLPGAAAVLILGYAWFWYMNREIYEGPPLYEVTGTVIQSGKPLPGVNVEFAPAEPDPNQEVLAAAGITDDQGRFRLRAFDSQYGAPAGPYIVGLINPSGIPINLPEELIRQTVTPDGKNEFQLSF
ncbi:MAG: carboxypeptidase-like regulatory domain-containing protein, partial [Planctomycetota bacterium]